MLEAYERYRIEQRRRLVIQYNQASSERKMLLSIFTAEEVLRSEYIGIIRLLHNCWTSFKSKNDDRIADIHNFFKINMQKYPHETRTDVSWFETTITPCSLEGEELVRDMDNFILETELTK